MTQQAMAGTLRALLADGKGLLAMDESTATCNRRFADAGIPQTQALRHAYRELLMTTPGLGTGISGLILVDETLRQSLADGRPFVQVAREAGLVLGIKVDQGAKPLAAHPGEKVTEGLDGLRERLQAYAELGARFAKWRAVMAIDDVQLPSPACIDANAHALARYATLCQEAGLVPVVEAEVLMDGGHTRMRCQAVTEALLGSVFRQLERQGVALEAMILKCNMVLAGRSCALQDAADEVADSTLQCLRRVVPAAVPGIMFLSGGQSAELASSRLHALQRRHEGPWPLSFSFARALQQPALGLWAGNPANGAAAQAALMHRVRCNRAALLGTYSSAMEAA